MIKNCRVINPLGIDYMAEKLLVDEDFSKEALVRNLKYKLTHQPDSVLILQAYEGEDLIAFLIAHAPQGFKHTFIQQAWLSPGTKTQIADRMFLKLLMWTEEIGRKEIRGETLRDPKAFFQRWKFEEFSTILSFRLDDEFQDKLFDHLFNTEGLREQQNGQGLEGQRRPDSGKRPDSDSSATESERQDESGSSRSAGQDNGRPPGRPDENGADGSADGNPDLQTRSGDDGTVCEEGDLRSDDEDVRGGDSAEDK